MEEWGDRRILSGMSQISDYTGLSDRTILGLIRNNRFPARKTIGDGGTWISHKDAVDKWTLNFCMSSEKNSE